MSKVLIYGAGGLGRLVHDILLCGRSVDVVGFLDSDPAKHAAGIDGLTVFGGIDQIDRLRWAGVSHAIVAIGDSRQRVHVAEQLRERGMQLASAVHPLASISPTADIADHVIIGARVTVCVHARIAEHVVLSTGSIIDHECTVGRGAFLHPAVRLAGAVAVGERAVLGIGSSVIPCRKIGRSARVAPGSVVIRDVPPGATVSGVPAQRVLGDSSRFIPDVAAALTASHAATVTGA